MTGEERVRAYINAVDSSPMPSGDRILLATMDWTDGDNHPVTLNDLRDLLEAADQQKWAATVAAPGLIDRSGDDESVGELWTRLFGRTASATETVLRAALTAAHGYQEQLHQASEAIAAVAALVENARARGGDSWGAVDVASLERALGMETGR